MNGQPSESPSDTGFPRKWLALIAVKVVLLVVAGVVVFSIYGCNTVQGIGRDLEQAGAAIQRKAGGE